MQKEDRFNWHRVLPQKEKGLLTLELKFPKIFVFLQKINRSPVLADTMMHLYTKSVIGHALMPKRRTFGHF